MNINQKVVINGDAFIIEMGDEFYFRKFLTGKRNEVDVTKDVKQSCRFSNEEQANKVLQTLKTKFNEKGIRDFSWE